MIYGCIHFDSRFQCAIPHITTRAQCKYHFLQSETALALCSDTSWKKRKKNFKTHPAAKKKKKKKRQFSTEKKQFGCTHEQPISCVLISRHLDFRSTGSVKSFLSAFLFIFLFRSSLFSHMIVSFAGKHKYCGF